MDPVLKDYLREFLPLISIFVTAYVAIKVAGVHKLVNSEMDKFRETLKKLAEREADAVFRAGQQAVRDANRSTLSEAARATTAAGNATTAAAEATSAAIAAKS